MIASLTAMTISAVVAPAIGAWMIGSSISNRSRIRLVTITSCFALFARHLAGADAL